MTARSSTDENDEDADGEKPKAGRNGRAARHAGVS